MGAKYLRNITKILKTTSGRLFGRVSASTGRAEELTPEQVRTLLEVSTTTEIAAAYQPIGDYATGAQGDLADSAVQPGDLATVATTGSYNDLADKPSGGSGDVVGPTSATDNAAVRYDTTTGKLLQDSNLLIGDLLTVSPNNTVNHLCLEPTGGTTNVSVSIKPKGTGSFSLHAPDGTTTGGNVRGAYAVDLCTSRSNANQVASGLWSALVGGGGNRASGNYAVCVGGNLNVASGQNSTAIGDNNTASGYSSFAGSTLCTASGDHAFCFGYQSSATANRTFALGMYCTASAELALSTGLSAASNRYAMYSRASGAFSATGDAQKVEFVLRNKTTNSTATTLFLNGSSTRLTIPSGKILFADVLVSGIKSDGSAAACYKRKVAIKNVGGTTSLVGSVETIGTDIEDNASTDVAITADDTNDALQIDVTGITSETWRWVAVVEGLEIAYGT